MINNSVFIKYFVFFLSITNGIFLYGMDAPTYSLPPEIMPQILCRCSYNDSGKEKGIIETMKTVVSLNSTCKEFQKLLDDNFIATLFDQYDITSKDELISKIIFCKDQLAITNGINPTFYQSKRRLISILLCSEAALKDGGALVYSALKYDDVELIQFLHDKKKVNLYQVHGWQKIPIFFYASSIAMVELFEKKGIKLDSTSVDDSYPNVLWNAIICDHIPVEVVEYYFEKNISAEPRTSDGCSLLHALANSCCASRKIDRASPNIDHVFDKAALLLAKQPESINALDKDKKTPLDYGISNFVLFDHTDSSDKMIAFLKSRGGKRSEELLPQPAKYEGKCVLS